jgi:RimJ/RimL family protein N-acetyltransferase
VSAPAASAGTRPLARAGVEGLIRLLETDFGRSRDPVEGVLAHQQLLDALDRGEHDRFVVWGATGKDDDTTLAVCYAGSSGSVVAAGDPAGGPALAESADRVGWRVLIADIDIGEALLDATPRPLFRRRAHAREQHFMVARDARATEGVATGLRRARREDLPRLTEYAAALHVEDQMGPPVNAAGRSAVRARLLDSISRGRTWVVERGGEAVAKFDVSLYSRRRGAQIAGVYVAEGWRGQGIATDATRALVAGLLEDGLPGVTLHVRADNTAAAHAYERAGFGYRRSWLLALR